MVTKTSSLVQKLVSHLCSLMTYQPHLVLLIFSLNVQTNRCIKMSFGMPERNMNRHKEYLGI
jgi:hypothetical protein